MESSSSSRARKCNLSQIFDNKASNIALISRCISGLDSKVLLSESFSNDKAQKGPLASLVTAHKKARMYTIDNVQYEFTIEPDLNQVLIEGDSLELSCYIMKKIIPSPDYSKKQTNLNTQVKWLAKSQFIN